MGNEIVRQTDRALATPLSRYAEGAAKDAQNSKASATLRAYERAWGRFEAWCDRHDQQALPASPVTVASYLRFLCPDTDEEGIKHKVATMEMALVAISQRHKVSRLQSPRSDPLVSQTRQGIRRRLGTAPDKVAALMQRSVKRIVAACDMDDVVDVRDATIVVFGFVGAMRRSEIVGLDVADCTIVERGVDVRIRRSKTDQEGAGENVSLPRSSDESACPAQLLVRWLEVSGITSGPLFRRIRKPECKNRIGKKRLTAGSVAAIVKKHVRRAGLRPSDYSGHSLRAGLATSAAEAGRPLEAIKRQTRHKSSSVAEGYLRHGTRWDKNAADGLL